MVAALSILRGSTQAVHSYPPALGVPSSVTVRVRTPSESLPDVGVSASVDAVNAALASSASEGATTIAFASDPGCVPGRTYLLAHAGRVVVVEVIATGTEVRLAEPLPMAFPTGATLRGWHCSLALTALQTELAGEGLAVWTATVAGQPVTWAQQLRVVKQLVAYTLTGSRLTQAYPVIHQVRARTDEDLSESIRTAWDFLVVPRLEAKGLLLERIKSWDRLEPLHAAAVIYHQAMQNPRMDRAFVDALEADMRKKEDLVLAGVAFWYDAADESGVRNENAPPQPWRFVTRVR